MFGDDEHHSAEGANNKSLKNCARKGTALRNYPFYVF